MLGFLKAFIILSLFSLVVLFCIYCWDKKFYVTTEDKNGNTRILKKENIKIINYTAYRDLVIMFSNITQIIAAIDEINILINKNAEVTPTVLKDSKEISYKSFDNLIVWRVSYIKRLIYEYTILNDYYTQVRFCLPEITNKMFGKELIDIYNYIKQVK